MEHISNTSPIVDEWSGRTQPTQYSTWFCFKSEQQQPNTNCDNAETESRFIDTNVTTLSVSRNIAVRVSSSCYPNLNWSTAPVCLGCTLRYPSRVPLPRPEPKAHNAQQPATDERIICFPCQPVAVFWVTGITSTMYLHSSTKLSEFSSFLQSLISECILSECQAFDCSYLLKN